jgi:hypothetical protein
MHSAPPRSSASPKFRGERGSQASRGSSATTPIKCKFFNKIRPNCMSILGGSSPRWRSSPGCVPKNAPAASEMGGDAAMRSELTRGGAAADHRPGRLSSLSQVTAVSPNATFALGAVRSKGFLCKREPLMQRVWGQTFRQLRNPGIPCIVARLLRTRLKDAVRGAEVCLAIATGL